MAKDSYGEPLHGEINQECMCPIYMDIEEGGQMERIGKEIYIGGAPTFTERVCQYEKVPPTGVGFCAACYPHSDSRVLAGGGRPMMGFPPSNIQWRGDNHARTRSHHTYHEISGTCDYGPGSVHIVELDILVHYHGPSCVRFPGINGVLVRVPRNDSEG